jgi:hypothetical protein
MSEITDEAYSEAMDEIEELRRRISIRDAELANAAKKFEEMAKLITELADGLSVFHNEGISDCAPTCKYRKLVQRAKEAVQ